MYTRGGKKNVGGVRAATAALTRTWSISSFFITGIKCVKMSMYNAGKQINFFFRFFTHCRGEKYRFDPDLYRPYTHQVTNYNMSVDVKDAVMHELSRKEDVQGVYSAQPGGRRQHGALNRHGSEGYSVKTVKLAQAHHWVGACHYGIQVPPKGEKRCESGMCRGVNCSRPWARVGRCTSTVQ